jgi:transcriptional regulator with XRE-family HTH domain
VDEVRRLRLEKGWSQNELAYHAKLAPSVISLIETGKRDPNATTLRKLAEALEVRIPDLFEEGGSGKARRRSSLEPSLFNGGLEEERRSHELRFWITYLNHLTEHFAGFTEDAEAKPCRRYGRADVAPGVAADALTALEVLLAGIQEGAVEAAPQDVRDALRAGFRLAKTADRIDELGTPSEEDAMRGVRDDQDRMLTEIKFRKLVEDFEGLVSTEDRQAIFS